MSPTRICLVPHLSGVGGMVTFQAKLAVGLATRGIEVCYDLSDTPYRAVLVIGGTHDLAGLWRIHRRGISIVQRLDGMNWVHRRRRTGLRHFLRAEYGNFILATIRSRLADRIVYQSEFSRQWWHRERGPTKIYNQVVYNGVDLGTYTPNGAGKPPTDRNRLLLVEGNLGGGYEMGLETAVQLAECLRIAHSRDIEIVVVGRVTPSIRSRWDHQTGRSPGILISFSGVVPIERIPEIDRSAHLLYSADLHPACPNSVVEALACGLPVVGFDTGALPELVTGDSGRIAPYGGNPWLLEPPDIPTLAEATAEIFVDQDRFRTAARARAEEAFRLDKMVEGYLQVLLG